MGMFPGTCFLSNLPIEEGDPVVGMILHQNFFKDSRSRSLGACSLLEPMMLPFRGKYNNYGGIDKVEYPEDVRKGMFAAFRKQDAELVHEEMDFEVTSRGLLILGRKEWKRETNVNFSEVKGKEVNDIDDVIKLIGNGELKVKIEDKELFTTIILMHERLYNVAVKNMRTAKDRKMTLELIKAAKGVKSWEKFKSIVSSERVDKHVNHSMSLFLIGMSQVGEIGTCQRLSREMIVARPDLMLPVVDDYLDLLGFCFLSRRMFVPQCFGPQEMYLKPYKELFAAANKILYSKKETAPYDR